MGYILYMVGIFPAIDYAPGSEMDDDTGGDLPIKDECQRFISSSTRKVTIV
jgi:hypothetical protein